MERADPASRTYSIRDRSATPRRASANVSTSLAQNCTATPRGAFARRWRAWCRGSWEPVAFAQDLVKPTRVMCYISSVCGRFHTNRLTWREIVALYRLTVPMTSERNLPPRYNICPTTTIDAVIERDAKRARADALGGWCRPGGKRRPRKLRPHSMRVLRRSVKSRCFAPRSSATAA